MADNFYYVTNPPPRRCSRGHTMEPLGASWLSIGGNAFCLECIEEKIPALLDVIGIGRILPKEGEEE